MVADSLRWTTRDLEVMPDDGGWKRHEIVDGELYVTRAPHLHHQRAVGKIHRALDQWSDQTQRGQPFVAPGVIFTRHDAVIPDLVWVSQERLAVGLDEAGHLTVAPELVVEILSPGTANEQRDKEIKLKLYSRHGVQDYWIVDWRLQTVEVYRRRDVQLHHTSTLLSGDTLTTSLLPGFSVPVAQIFQ
ncbi:MAG: Uma2 family endonuclease [Spirulinaceae cyanobacterium SM2_1_0]|nr:Uma2 family endonuclease [Spirulinaceae cyanobacterium SM2_1_0]